MQTNLFSSDYKKYLILILFGITVTTLSILTVYFPVALNVPFNVVIPVIIALYYSKHFFYSLKIFTLSFTRLLVALAVLGYFPTNILMIIIVAFIVINISEAIGLDFKNKNYFNLVNGIAVAASAILLKLQWIDYYYIINNPTVTYWIIAYSIWNYNFIALNFPRPVSLFHGIFSVLLPIVLMFIARMPEFWLIVRTSMLVENITIELLIKARAPQFISLVHSNRYNRMINLLQKKPSQFIVTILIFLFLLLFIFL